MEARKPRILGTGKPAVAVEREVWIQADSARVWEVLTDVPRWSRLHRGIAFARLQGELAAGTKLHWRVDGMNVTSTLSEVDPERVLAWKGKCLGARIHYRWDLEPTASGTRVRAVEAVDGVMIRILRGTVRKTVERSLDEWVQGLKRSAEESRR